MPGQMSIIHSIGRLPEVYRPIFRDPREILLESLRVKWVACTMILWICAEWITAFSCLVCIAEGRGTTPCMPPLRKGTWSRCPDCKGIMTWIRGVRGEEKGNWGWWGHRTCTTTAATLASATTGRSLRRNPTANCSEISWKSSVRIDRFLFTDMW
jgi:hypothetical protein